MRTNNRIRLALALTTLLIALQWSPPAAADTFTGTVGALAAGSSIILKFTDLSITKGCYGAGNPADYAFLTSQTALYREVFALLLISKKGTPITCTTSGSKGNPGGCQIAACELP